MMTTITKEFTYNLPDDQYYQTNTLLKTANLTYTGPAVKYLQVDSETNYLTGSVISEAEFEDYNNEDDGFYAVEVDCSTNPLMCAIVNCPDHTTGQVDITEEVPGDTVSYVRADPPDPEHTYEVTGIEYNRATGNFVKPFPWKSPYVTWESTLQLRDIQLRNTDIRLSEDLTTSLYTSVANFKQYLRDFPVTFGAGWDIVIAAAGTGYAVGDRCLISDSIFKNNSAAPDIVIRVESVDDAGAITKISKQTSAHAYTYHNDAATYEDVYYTTDSASGTGLQITLTKVKTVDPWKITIKSSPLE